MDNCVEEFSLYNTRTKTYTYLTNMNIKLAKNNKKIKENIQRKIIEQNQDESCKINEKYEITFVENKRSAPCLD